MLLMKESVLLFAVTGFFISLFIAYLIVYGVVYAVLYICRKWLAFLRDLQSGQNKE